jgi:hypothetical protein
MAATPEDAATAVYAEVTGQDIADIPRNNPGFLEMKDTKSYIYRVLDWLADNAQSNDSQLQFQRFDLNRVVTQVNIRMRGSRVRLGLLIFRFRE